MTEETVTSLGLVTSSDWQKTSGISTRAKQFRYINRAMSKDMISSHMESGFTDHFLFSRFIITVDEAIDSLLCENLVEQADEITVITRCRIVHRIVKQRVQREIATSLHVYS